LLTINGKTGWREVEIGRGSRPDTCPVVLLETWMRLGRIAHGPLFRPIARKNGGVSSERLTDKHVARLVRKTALAAGIRGDLSEGERKRLWRPFAARRPRLLRANRGSPCAKTSRPRERRDDSPISAETRPVQGQSHQSGRIVTDRAKSSDAFASTAGHPHLSLSGPRASASGIEARRVIELREPGDE
jgi:hypothetical protein